MKGLPVYMACASVLSPKAVILTDLPPMLRVLPSMSLNMTPSLLLEIGLPPVMAQMVKNPPAVRETWV